MAGLTRWDPFTGATPFDDLFNGFWGTTPHAHGHSAPMMDLYTEDDKSLVAEVQAPGFTKDDIEVNIHDGVLEIKGEKHNKEDGTKNKRNYMVRESHESFYRSIQLPRVADGEHISAHFEDGVLKVTVPFKELPSPKKVSITEAKKK